MYRSNFIGIVRGLPQGIEPTITVSAPTESCPYEVITSFGYIQSDLTEQGYWTCDIVVRQVPTESGSQWGPFTLTISSPGCNGTSFVADDSEEFDVFLKKITVTSLLADETNSYWVKDIDARVMLGEKTDTDLTNTTDNGKILMSDMGMPSSIYTNLTIGASGSKYVAPASGYYYVRLSSMGTNQYFRFMVKTSSNDLLYATRLMRPNSASYADLYIPIYKGFTLEVEYTASGVEVFRFIYAVGSESEAQ